MIALVDANNFYVSCERAFDPKLEGKSVAVLSNNDGCVISRLPECKAQVFSEKMTALMNGYLNGQITNEKVIQELLAMANDIMAGDRSEEMSQEELAFYEAITRPEVIKDFYTHDVLVAMTKELTDQLRKNRTVDWQYRNDARAHMRMLVIQLLKKYKYPPEGLDAAMETVLKQCEVWTDNAP